MEYILAFGCGFFVPGLAAFLCLVGAARWDRRRPRDVLGAVVYLAVPAWCWFLQLGPWRPAESWQWLPWLGILACVINAAATHKWILWIFYSLFVLLAAWLLVPDIERLAAERTFWLVAVPLTLLVS